MVQQKYERKKALDRTGWQWWFGGAGRQALANMIVSHIGSREIGLLPGGRGLLSFATYYNKTSDDL